MSIEPNDLELLRLAGLKPEYVNNIIEHFNNYSSSNAVSDAGLAMRVYKDTTLHPLHLNGSVAKAIRPIEAGEVFSFPIFRDEPYSSFFDGTFESAGNILFGPRGIHLPVPLSSIILEHSELLCTAQNDNPSPEEITNAMTSHKHAQYRDRDAETHISPLSLADLDTAIGLGSVKSLNLAYRNILSFNTLPLRTFFDELEHVDVSGNYQIDEAAALEDAIQFINDNQLLAYDCFNTCLEPHIPELMRRCPTLKRCCTYFDVDDFLHLDLDYLKNIRFLKLGCISHDFLAQVLSAAPHLEILDLTLFESLTLRHLDVIPPISLILSNAFIDSVSKEDLMKFPVINDTVITLQPLNFYPATIVSSHSAALSNTFFASFQHSNHFNFRACLLPGKCVVCWAVKKIHIGDALTRDFYPEAPTDFHRKHYLRILYDEDAEISPIPSQPPTINFINSADAEMAITQQTNFLNENRTPIFVTDNINVALSGPYEVTNNIADSEFMWIDHDLRCDFEFDIFKTHALHTHNYPFNTKMLLASEFCHNALFFANLTQDLIYLPLNIDLLSPYDTVFVTVPAALPETAINGTCTVKNAAILSRLMNCIAAPTPKAWAQAALVIAVNSHEEGKWAIPFGCLEAQQGFETIDTTHFSQIASHITHAFMEQYLYFTNKYPSTITSRAKSVFALRFLIHDNSISILDVDNHVPTAYFGEMSQHYINSIINYILNGTVGEDFIAISSPKTA